MGRQEFLKRVKIGGAAIGLAAITSVSGCTNKEITKETEIQNMTKLSIQERNEIKKRENEILKEYNKDLQDLKNEIRRGNSDELDLENELVRGIQILTALKNGLDIGVEKDESQSIIPEKSGNGLIIGYKLPQNLEEILEEGLNDENKEEFLKAKKLLNGEINYEAAEIYNEYYSELLKTDNQKVEAIEKMKENISKNIRKIEIIKNDEGR